MDNMHRIVGKDGEARRVKPVLAVSTKNVPAPIVNMPTPAVRTGEIIIIEGQVKHEAI